MSINEYIIDALLNADKTSMTINGVIKNLCVADGQPRLSTSHTLPNSGAETFSNISAWRTLDYFTLTHAMAEFYKNSLFAGEPALANILVCHKNVALNIPVWDREDQTFTVPSIKRIEWEHDGWFLFSSRFGFLSDKWFHIFGSPPSA